MKQLAPEALDERLRALLNPCYAGTEKEFVALGRPGFERVLEAMEGKVSFAPPSDDFHDHFDYQAGLRFAVAAFAAEDVAGVLAELEARRWSDLRIATSGVGRVADARVVPLLLRAHADKDIQTRVGAVHCLGMQRDPRATEALLRALSDRASDVRLAAIEALGEIGDPRAIEPLTALAAKPARSTYLADQAIKAIRKIRRGQPKRPGKRR